MSAAGYAIYKRCVPGDRRKVEASAVDASSGGGARDLRFNPVRTFAEVVPLVFPEPGVGKNGRRFSAGQVRWYDDGVVCGPITVKMWEPNEARSEFRIGKIYEVTPFDEDHIPPQEEDPFFLIWTDEDGKIWARYETVPGFENEEWAPKLVQPILDSVSQVKQTQNIRGWRNLVTGDGDHCDGR